MQTPTTLNFAYDLVTREDITNKIKALAWANIVNNWDYGKSANGKSNRSYFSFFMPTDWGSKLVAQLISYEGKGNVFIDFISQTKFVDSNTLLPKEPDTTTDQVIAALA
jgi:hypothetical protein